MKLNTQHRQNEPLEQLPATRPGDRVVRRWRKTPGRLRSISHRVSRFFKGMASKYRGLR